MVISLKYEAQMCKQWNKEDKSAMAANFYCFIALPRKQIISKTLIQSTHTNSNSSSLPLDISIGAKGHFTKLPIDLDYQWSTAFQKGNGSNLSKVRRVSEYLPQR